MNLFWKNLLLASKTECMFSQLNIAWKVAICLQLYEFGLRKQTTWNMDQETQKSIAKELSTFLLWGNEQIIGYKSEEKDFRKTVTKIWCKVCAKHKDESLNHPTLKGVAETATRAFISGTSSVTKHQVEFF